MNKERKVFPQTPFQKKERVKTKILTKTDIELYSRSTLVRLQELYYGLYSDDSLVGFLEWLRERENGELEEYS